MAFMQPTIYKGDVVIVESECGSTCIEGCVFSSGDLSTLAAHWDDDNVCDGCSAIVRPYHEGENVQSIIAKRDRWIAYLSSPGYMDRTDAADFDTREEAEAYLRETYGDEDTESEDES